MADISAEISAFQNAVYGENVRDALVNLANKLNNESSAAAATVEGYVTTANKVAKGLQIVASGVGLDGVVYLNGHWVHGNISSAGTISYSTTYNYQVISDIMMCYDTDITIDASTGYKFIICYYSNSTIDSQYFTSKTNDLMTCTIPSGQYFTIIMLKSGGQATEVTISEIVRKYQIRSDYKTAVDDVHRMVNDNKADIAMLLDSMIDGRMYIGGHWVNGHIYSSGGITTEGYLYEVVSDTTICTSKETIIKVDKGYKGTVHTYSAQEITPNNFTGSYSFTSQYTIPANTYYTLSITLNPSSSSQILDPSVGSRHVYVYTSIVEAIDNAELVPHIDTAIRTGKYYFDGNWKHGNLSSEGNPSYADIYITQVMPDKVFYTNVDMTVIIQEGYKLTVVYYSGPVLSSSDYVSQEDVIKKVFIQAETYFSFIVKKSGQSGEMDIQAASKVAYIETPLTDTIVDGVAEIFNLQRLPEYWINEIDDKIDVIVSRDAEIGNDGDSFIFITDVHMFRNSLHSPALIKQILNRTSVSKVFFGGDLIEKYSGATGKTDAMRDYSVWNNLMYEADEFFIVGNHDNNNYDGTNAEQQLSDSEIYGLAIKRAEGNINTNRKTSYYIDNVSQKTRYIILDCEGEGLYTDVLDWMQDRLQELQSEWKALIMQHRYWGSSTSTVSSQGTALTAAINEVFGTLNCEIVAVIVGHTHTDYNITDSTNGYPIIAVNCDTRDGSVSGYTRVAGTISEQSFDVFHINYDSRTIRTTRIGAGNDRVISY